MATLKGSKRKVTASQRRPLKPAFVCIARDILLVPPVAHRHTSAAKNFLTRFEFGIALAVIAAATRQWSEDRHARAFEDGGERIQRQKHKLQAAQRNRGPKTKDYPFTREQREWEFFIRRRGEEPTGREPVNVRRIFEREGRQGYRRSRQWQREQGPPATGVLVQCSRRSLLTSVGLPTTSASYVRLEKALDRLCAPVAKQPPVLLTGWMPTSDGQVRFRVTGAWLDLRDRGFARLPLPLPGRRSETALALYLFLNSIPTFNSNSEGIAPAQLCARLGMSRRGRSGSRLSASLRLARKTINADLAELDEAILRKHKLDAVPLRYRMQLVGRERRIRFLAIPRNAEAREEMEFVLEQRKRAREEDDFAPTEPASYEPEEIERVDDARLQALKRKLAYAEGGSDYDY